MITAEQQQAYNASAGHMDATSECFLLALAQLPVKPRTLVDVGCGGGAIIHTATALGIEAVGVDIVVPHADPRFIVHDLTQPMGGRLSSPVTRADLVTCWEVAEHLPAKSAEHLIDTLTHLAGSYVIFTAARPGQGGHGHLNEQPQEYWRRKFHARGLVYCETMTARVRDAWLPVTRCWWYAQNVQVFL